jgi:hypothetical protein
MEKRKGKEPMKQTRRGFKKKANKKHTKNDKQISKIPLVFLVGEICHCYPLSKILLVIKIVTGTVSGG